MGSGVIHHLDYGHIISDRFIQTMLDYTVKMMFHPTSKRVKGNLDSDVNIAKLALVLEKVWGMRKMRSRESRGRRTNAQYFSTRGCALSEAMPQALRQRLVQVPNAH
ncbi:hypothetical protein [Nostoc sp.]|uniref:hypothetical protein n=1 Tax=Nostoc sp. TaxID=1180 RepID=UPI002FF6CCB1